MVLWNLQPNFVIRKDENIRYIRRYIFDKSNIDDVQHDISDDISGLWHTRALV